MGFGDRLKQLTKKAKGAAAAHPDKINQAVEKAGRAADQRTGGKYHDRIATTGTKVETYVENLEPETPAPGHEPPRSDAATGRQSTESGS